MTVITQGRPVFCGVCARPTGEEIQPGGRPRNPFCEDCTDLPEPWTVNYDHPDGVQTFIREDVRLNTPGANNTRQLGARLQRANRLVVNGPTFQAEAVPLPTANAITPVEPEPQTGRAECRGCGGTEFMPRINATTRGWATGWGPTTNTADYDVEPGDTPIVYVENWIDDMIETDYDEIDNDEVEYVECTNCGRQWEGEWDYV